MFVSGVHFQVLSPAFTVHWGLQSKQARPAWRELQNNENRRHFDLFKREVAVRYRRVVFSSNGGARLGPPPTCKH
ncbi:Beta-1,4-glucuronyltransferase 1 [Frankliniella fusca]|uniref:Beta-1,4-glucuronyltransferase 1 n=1 Tax=Frankliniella fusca TaxID=407009 RepID=A0AAE1I4W0_9NEOP|nr:Beta-1,4-glucuronyltransferase 1 [Frankliniella fusca]